MKIGGEARIGYIQVRHWERFAAKETGLPTDEVLGICESVAAETPDRFTDVVAIRPVGRTGSPDRGKAEGGDYESGQDVSGQSAKVKGDGHRPVPPEHVRAPGRFCATIGRALIKKWSLLDSNQRPLRCERSALPTELSDRTAFLQIPPRGIEPRSPG